MTSRDARMASSLCSTSRKLSLNDCFIIVVVAIVCSSRTDVFCARVEQLRGERLIDND